MGCTADESGAGAVGVDEDEPEETVWFIVKVASGEENFRQET